MGDYSGYDSGGQTGVTVGGDTSGGITIDNQSLGLSPMGSGNFIPQPAGFSDPNQPQGVGVDPYYANRQAPVDTAAPLFAQMQNDLARANAVGPLQDAARNSANTAQNLAKQIMTNSSQWANAQDPFASTRGMFAQKLQDLMSNPWSIGGVPGYNAGMQAIQRHMGALGYGNSGNLLASASQYSGDFFLRYMQMLGGFAGAGQTPGAGAGTAMQGMQSAANLIGQGQASAGYAASLDIPRGF